MQFLRILAALILCLMGLSAARIKELATVEGVRDNQLIGYGLVVGLNGTGDKRQTFFSTQTLANVLDRMGVQISPQAILVRNTAAVLITANLPPFGQPGSRMDVTVAAIGDSTNLQGGLLIVTPLKGLDGQVYAVAQGAVVTGGFAAKGGGGNSATLNHPTAGRIPAGAIIERPAPSVPPAASVRLQLRQADFTTASRITGAINKRFPGAAKAANSGLVEAAIPADWSERRVEFLAEIEGLAVNADRVAKIIVNERSGTIVLGKEVKLAPVAILHGALSIEIQTTFDVSQPAPLNESGKTVVTPETRVNVKEEKAKSLILKEGATVEDLVRSLQSIGATARDIIAILQNLRSAGAIEAELEVI